MDETTGGDGPAPEAAGTDEPAPETAATDEPAAGGAAPAGRSWLRRGGWPGLSAVSSPRSAPGRSVREVVNGLDRLEITLGTLAAALDLAVSIAAYFYLRHSAQKLDRESAPTELIAGLVAGALMLAGLAFRRRALLGFGAFITGLEFLSSNARNLLGALLYLAFGGWLITRAMQKQRLERAGAASARQSARSRPVVPTGAPKASKRYTPPKRSGAGRRR